MEAGGDIGQGQGQGAKFPTRTCESYDANDEAAWGGERRRATSAAHYTRLCSADPRDPSKKKYGRRVQRRAPRSLGGSSRTEARPRAVQNGGKRATDAAHYQRWCSADLRDRSAAALELRRCRVFISTLSDAGSAGGRGELTSCWSIFLKK
jgi:hypothetical protein